MPSRINCLGVGISAINLTRALHLMGAWIDGGVKGQVHFCNVHTVMECWQDARLRSIINHADLALPDGMPLVWFCRFQGEREVSRVYGPDLMHAFCAYSVAKGYRHYFYGGAPGVSDRLTAALQRHYPGLQVAGTHTPPLRPLGAIEKTSVIAAVNALEPDIIWVGLGTPKQDYWLGQHRSLLKAPVLAAVGAAFDMLSGKLPQAPVWMQRCGLEWLFRLQREPRRLAYRYLIFNPLFAMNLLLQITRMRRYVLESEQLEFGYGHRPRHDIWQEKR
jgi:N-acetylglucosaminyldiphosphoundecaprenol N-acetyl-beta-D-mannosaminyltransferase